MCRRDTQVQQAIEYFESLGAKVESYQPPDVQYNNGGSRKQGLHFNLTGAMQETGLNQREMRELHRATILNDFLVAHFADKPWFDQKAQQQTQSRFGPFGDLITKSKEWRRGNLVARATSFANFADELYGMGMDEPALRVQWSESESSWLVVDRVYYAKAKGFHLGDGSSYSIRYRFRSPKECATLLFEPEWQGQLLQEWDRLVPLDKLSKLVAFL
ncbi:MAG TPA: hypothetical protein VKU41_08135 [Polyangiaceae bacterium]|nr:hypothetical protein [Polyangiaceae bacterium]